MNAQLESARWRLNQIQEQLTKRAISGGLLARRYFSASPRPDLDPPDLKEAGWEEGSTTVEYAIGAIATAGFAGLLVAVLKSGGVKGMITSIIQTALSL